MNRLATLIAATLAVVVAIVAMPAAGLTPPPTAVAQSIAPPANQQAGNTGAPGEVIVTWNAAAGAAAYRVGWLNHNDYLNAGSAWLQRFTFADVPASVRQYTITRLTPGEEYWFIVASVDANNRMYWPQSWIQKFAVTGGEDYLEIGDTANWSGFQLTINGASILEPGTHQNVGEFLAGRTYQVLDIPGWRTLRLEVTLRNDQNTDTMLNGSRNYILDTDAGTAFVIGSGGLTTRQGTERDTELLFEIPDRARVAVLAARPFYYQDAARNTPTLFRIPIPQETVAALPPQQVEVPPIPTSITSSSTSAGYTPRLTLTIGNLPFDMTPGSSIELYLEDDFQVPGEIDPSSVYFTATGPRTIETSNGGRVYATDYIYIDSDDHFGGGDDWSIQVYLPDFDSNYLDGFQGPMRGQQLQMVILGSSGIRNPSEAGTHSVGYSVLGPNDSGNDGPQVQLDDLRTYAKISLSDEDNVPGYRLTVTGSGFNDGATAAVYVLADPDTDADLGALVSGWGESEAMACLTIIQEGYLAGAATVGADDRVAITFEVTVPPFRPGPVNYLCMVDSEGRASYTDVETFELTTTN